MIMVAKPFIALSPIVFFLLAALALVIFLIVKRQWTALAILLGAFAVVPMVLYTVLHVSDEVQVVAPRQYVESADGITTRVDPDLAFPDASFRADVYPSASSATRALARWWRTTQADSPAARAPIVRVGGTIPRELANAFLSEIRTLRTAGQPQQFAHDSALTDNQSPPAGETWILLHNDQQPARTAPWSSQPRQVVDGTIRVVIRHGIETEELLASYKDKPWLENLQSFTAGQRQGHWLIVHSGLPAASPGEASLQARSRVEQEFYERVRERIVTQHPTFRRTLDDRLLRQTVHNYLRSHSYFVIDSLTQEFSQPYGRVWRESLLINISETNVTGVTYAAIASLNRHRMSWARGIGSIGALALITFLLYLLLNNLTRGYFTWSLRLAAIILALAGTLIVIIIA